MQGMLGAEYVLHDCLAVSCEKYLATSNYKHGRMLQVNIRMHINHTQYLFNWRSLMELFQIGCIPKENFS